MASIIPNRPPDTPLLNFYSTGTYTKQISYDQFKGHSAFPGASASIFDRNRRANEDVNIKPITQNKVPLEFYNPKSYLKPFDVHEQAKDLSLNSLHSTRIYNRKLAAIEQTKRVVTSPGMQVTGDEFAKMKKNYSSGAMTATNFEKTSKLVPLTEAQNYISQNENFYFKNSKTFHRPSVAFQKYQYSTPDYLRVLERTQNVSTMKQTGDLQNGTVTVISRNNGWLTVDPQTLSRKNAFDKKVKGDMHQASLMSPQWMQTDAKPENEKAKYFKAQSMNRKNIRCESNRVLMIERNQPLKSIFNLGQVRHNIMMKPETTQGTARNFSTEPVRMIEWKEDSSKQRFDKKIATKIGYKE